MRKTIFGTIFGTILLAALSIGLVISAIPASGRAASDNHTAREELEGKMIWERLRAKEGQCGDLSNDDFGALGEYFMGQTIGDRHAAMNEMMIRMMGEAGEREMHEVMGKRFSGCDTEAAYDGAGMNILPMMQMMMPYFTGGSDLASGFMGGESGPPRINKSNQMFMNFGAGSFFGWPLMFIWWALVIIAIIALVRWQIQKPEKENHRGGRAVEILKERYAKGEITKEEFESKKQDLI